LDLDYEKSEIEVSNSSTLEFGRCVDILNERGQYLKRATPDRPLQLVHINPTTKSEVFSLSPSDFTLHKFDQELSTLMDEYQSAAKKIPAGTPNSKSVALFLRLGDHRAILGADLETTANRNEGWYSILDNSLVLDRKSTLFKIPHHGSENGFCDELWVSQLDKKTISKLTPYNKNQKLPETAMLHKYSTLSKELYMTTLIYSDKPKKRNKEIEKILKRLKYNVREVKFEEGAVRCRIDLLDPTATWVVDPLFKARRIS
jgi:hypothetical protein